MAKEVGSSNVYRQRFVDYTNNYVESIPEPPEPEMGQSNAGSGAQKAVLNRSARYNDRKTTQSINAGGKPNAQK